MQISYSVRIQSNMPYNDLIVNHTLCIENQVRCIDQSCWKWLQMSIFYILFRSIKHNLHLRAIQQLLHKFLMHLIDIHHNSQDKLHLLYLQLYMQDRFEYIFRY